MKRLIGLVVIVLIFFAVLNYVGLQDKVEFKGLQKVSLIKTSDETYSLKGEMLFFNPSSFSSQLGNVNAQIFINEQFAGHIEQSFSQNIPSKSSFSFPFEIRFTHEEAKPSEKMNTIELKGKASSNSILFNYEISVNDTLNVSGFSE